MANFLKHVGRIKKNQKKCAVAYRIVPGTDDEAVIVPTESLSADEHDSLMNLIESTTGQQSYELAEAMARTNLPDGRIMLSAFHTQGKMLKVKTSEIEMTPNSQSTISLDDLNQTLATQQGKTVSELAIKDPNNPQKSKPTESSIDPVKVYSDDTMQTEVESASTSEEILTDEKLAAQYRSQADALFKEAKKLREQAEELVPTKKARSMKDSSAKK